MTRLRAAACFATVIAVWSIGACEAQSQAGSASRNLKSATVANAVVVPRTTSAVSPVVSDYTIGEQDVVKITVWKEPDLSTEVTVRPDGRITVPLLNDIPVIGMTTTQLQQLLTERYQPYVNVPQVTVTVKEINSRRAYVVGQVNKAGLYRINSATTVLQLLSEAGGLKEFAHRKRIYILRNESGRQVRYPFNYDDVIIARRPDQNIVLKPGDTIVVP